MSILFRYNELVKTLNRYDLYQAGDEVDLALENLKESIDESTDVKILNNLRTYLCGEDEELLVMYEKIKGAINQQCVIDYIDKVQTVEAFEYNFTCAEFIELVEP